MPIDQETLNQVRHLIRPLSTRTVNMVARATLQLVDDSAKMQRIQIGGVLGGPYPDVEHVQPYGFSSVPLAGADTVLTIFPNGDRGHPIVVAVGDRRYRPTGGEPGEVTVYNNTGASIHITKDGDILVRAAPGRDVLVDDGSGSTEPVVKRSEFLSHGHVIVATGAVSPCAGPVAGAAPAGSAALLPGTDAFKAK
jgi:phage baseplate assembly protein V